MANSMRAQDKCFGVRGTIHFGKWPITAGQTGIKAGNFIICDGSGSAAIAAANNAACGATSGNTNRILGRAAEDSTDENGTLKTTGISFIYAAPGTEFEVPIYHATAASAVATPATQPLTAYEMYNVGGVFAIDIGSTSAVKWVIKDYDTEDLPTWPGVVTAGTVLNPRVWVECMPAHSWTSIVS